jgi:hypothetical protein
MTIFTRPRWCIEPLRPHGKGATSRGRGASACCPKQLSDERRLPSYVSVPISCLTALRASAS